MKTSYMKLGLMTAFISASMAYGDAFTDLRYTFSGGSASALGGSADLTASDISLTDSTNQGISGSGNNVFIRGDVTDKSSAVAVPSSLFTTSYPAVDYLSWTLTADAGSQLEVNEVKFDYWNEASNGSSYSVAYALRSSVDGFASDLVVSDGGYLNGFIPYTDTTVYNAVATLGAAFEGLSSVEFRLFTYGDLGFNQSGERGRLDNIYTSGATSVVPEPATLGMVAVFGGGILFIRRRFMI